MSEDVDETVALILTDLMFSGYDAAYDFIYDKYATSEYTRTHPAPNEGDVMNEFDKLSALERLKAIICDPKGKVSINGSVKDIEIITKAIDDIESDLITNPAPNDGDVQKALDGLDRVEWVDDCDSDGFDTGYSGFDCDDASDFLTKHHKTIRATLQTCKENTENVTHSENVSQNQENLNTLDVGEALEALRKLYKFAELLRSQLLPSHAHNWPLKKHDGRAEASLIALYGFNKLNKGE